MLLSSPHVHTQFCDGQSSAEEMLISAVEHGFTSIGFSSHARQHFDPCASMDIPREQAYIAEINRLRKQYGSQISIHLGTELDLFSCADTAPYDYFLGAVHYIPTFNDFIAIDSSYDITKKLIDSHFNGDGIQMACEYFKLYAACMLSKRPAIAAHFDLIRKYNAAGSFFDETDPEYRNAALSALYAVKESGAVLEVNTGGMARAGLKTPYPDRFILEAWHDMNGNVILGSDCHYAPQIMAYYEEAAQYIKSCGFKKALVLSTGHNLFDETLL